MLCSSSENTVPQLLVDFWEALLVVCSQEEILQQLLLRVISQYVWRISKQQLPETKPLKTTEDLVSKPLRGSFRWRCPSKIYPNTILSILILDSLSLKRGQKGNNAACSYQKVLLALGSPAFWDICKCTSNRNLSSGQKKRLK